MLERQDADDDTDYTEATAYKPQQHTSPVKRKPSHAPNKLSPLRSHSRQHRQQEDDDGHQQHDQKLSTEEKQQRQMRSFLQNFLADDNSGALRREIDLYQHTQDTGIAVTDATIQEVVNAVPHVRGLRLSCCRAITDAGIWAIARQCKALESIALNACDRITDLGLRLLAHNCRLKFIDLSDCPQLTDTILQTLAAGCWMLETFIMQRCDRITDAGIVKVAQCCKGLRHLDVSECQHVGEYGDKALIEIGRSCPQLQVLDLFGCRHVRDLGLRAIAKGCPLLTTLKLTGCHDVSSVAIRALAKQCHSLRVLSLAGCIQTKNEDVETLARHCQELTWLDISGSPNIDVHGIRALADYCERLTYLNLSHCQRINDHALQALAAIGTRSNALASLSLASCPRITERGVELLTAACTNLVTLDLTDCAHIGRRFLQQLITKLEFVEWASTFFGFQPLPHAAELVQARDRRLLMNRSAVRIQAVMRGCLSRGGLWEAKLRYVERRVLPKIQARIRGFLVRRGIARDKQHAKEVKAAQLISQAYRDLRLRRMLARARRLRQIQQNEAEAALIFQKIYRGHCGRLRVRQMREELQQQRQYASRVQAMMEFAAIKLQRAYRGHRGRADAAVMRAAREAKRLQQLKEQRAVRTIQRVYRGHKGRQERARRLAHRREQKRRNVGATGVQSVFRGHQARRQARVLRDEIERLHRIRAATTIQRYWRGLRDKHMAAVLIGLIKLRAREVEAARKIQGAYRMHASRGFAKALRMTLQLQQKRTEAAIVLQRMVRGHLGRGKAEIARELQKLQVQARPLFQKEAKLKALVEDQHDKVESLRRKIQFDEADEKALAVELEKTMQIKTKYHDSSRITGTPQRYLTQYLQVQLADQLRTKRVELALDTRNLEMLTTAYSDAQKQLRIVRRDLEPLTEGVAKKTKENRTKRLQDKVRRERRAATQIQKVFRGYRVRCAVQEGGNCWIQQWNEEQQRPYYYNTFSGVIRWQRPLAMDLFQDQFVAPMKTVASETTSRSSGQWYEGFDDLLQRAYYYNAGSNEYQWEKPTDELFTMAETARRRKEWFDGIQQQQQGGVSALVGRSAVQKMLGEWEERLDPLSENVFYYHPPSQQIKLSLSPRSAHVSVHSRPGSGAASSRKSSSRSIRSARSVRTARSIHWQYRYGYEYDAAGQLIASPAPRPIWTEHVDPESAMTYYYNHVTNEYRWEKPADFNATYEETVHTPNASREWFKQQVDQEESLTERAARTRELGRKWTECVDPETQHTYYYNEITGETRWSLSPRSARDVSDQQDQIPLALFQKVKQLRLHPVLYTSRDTHMKWLNAAIREKNWLKVDAMVQQILLREQNQQVTERESAMKTTLNPSGSFSSLNDAMDYDIAMPSPTTADELSVEPTIEAIANDLEPTSTSMEPMDAIAEPLVEGWIECDDGQGNLYYFHTESGETTWTKPTKTNGIGTSDASMGWETAFDHDGNQYYYNVFTGETSWTKPSG